jgi:hypothetical protein
VSLAVAILVALVIWRSAGSGGDPGDKVMDELTPTVTVLPGYGTAALPWVSQIPQSLDASYAIKMEPHQDSCDGAAGTQGWSQAVVQSGFQWSKGLQALVAYVDPRLVKLGWSTTPRRQSSSPTATLIVPTGTWTKTLSNGTRADLSVTQEGESASSLWQLVALGNPVGRAPTGC